MLLGSRLQSNEHVFAFILLAIEIFALFPIFQREVKASYVLLQVACCVLLVLDFIFCCTCLLLLVCTCLLQSDKNPINKTDNFDLFFSLVCGMSAVQRNSERTHLVTAAVLFLLSTCLTWSFSRLLSVLSALFVLFLSFVCPLWFMHVQEYKKYVDCVLYMLRCVQLVRQMANCV